MKTTGALAFVGVCTAIAMAQQTVMADKNPTESKTAGSSSSSGLEGYAHDDYSKGKDEDCDKHDDYSKKKDDYSKKDDYDHDYSYGKGFDKSYGYNGGYSNYGNDYNVKCDFYGKGGYSGDYYQPSYYQPSYDYYSYGSYGRPSSYGYGGCKKHHKKQRRCRSSYSYSDY